MKECHRWRWSVSELWNAGERTWKWMTSWTSATKTASNRLQRHWQTWRSTTWHHQYRMHNQANRHSYIHRTTWLSGLARQRPTNLSWHISDSCLDSIERGSERAQNWHNAGSSEMAFSTARLRLHSVRLISHRQPGHVGVSSFRRASASRCDRQLAHIRWPFVHCNGHTTKYW